MKNIWLSLTATLVSICAMQKSQAQTLYAIIQQVSDKTDYLAKIEPSTGVVTKLSSTALATLVTGGVSTLDPIHNLFYFMSTGDTIYTVDLGTGDLVSKKKISNSGTYKIGLLEFSCHDSSLYAIAQTVSGNMDYLARLDPATGTVTMLSANALARFVNAGQSTLDPVHKRFYFMSSSDTLFAVDLTSGNLITKKKLSITGTYFNVVMEYNFLDSTVYAMMQKVADNTTYLSKIEPLTGAVSILTTTALSKFMSFGISSLDPQGRKFFFKTTGDTLRVADLSSGDLSYRNQMSVSGTYTIPLLEFDKSCPAKPTNAVVLENKMPLVSIYPNPFSDNTKVSLSGAITNTTLMLYNSAGQKLLESEMVNNTGFVDGQLLRPGVYSIRITSAEYTTIERTVVVVK